MALMFQRIARNYTKNGYFPTDSDTTERILNALTPCKSGMMRIIDPCAGEGVALAECKGHLHHPDLGQMVESFGVEYDKDRAYQAKELLDRCLHGDIQDVMISPRSFGLLWLNPPYGDLVSDKAQTGSQDKGKGKKRLEKLFFRQTAKFLQYGGVLVLIVPHYTLDREFQKMLATAFERLAVYMAPEQQFQQAVVLGVRRRNNSQDAIFQEGRRRLETFCQLDVEDRPVLPVTFADDDCYRVPAAQSADIRFHAVNIDPVQFEEEIERYPCLWQQLWHQMMPVTDQHRRPLMALSDWHLALALASGQVSGIVKSNDGRKTYVVKGDTFKDKKQSVEMEPLGDGRFREIRTSLDVFVPQIKAIDMSRNSSTFGEILTIK